MKGPSRQQYGRWCRNTFLGYLAKKWGALELRERWIFAEDGKKILVRVSRFNEKYCRYYWDAYENDWKSWDNNCYLALLMHDEQQLSYVLMSPKESQQLLDMTNRATDGSKNINVYMPSPGKLYILRWPDFPFSSRIVKIGPIIKPDFNFKSLPPEIQAILKKTIMSLAPRK
ncbi:MAG: hypothetical protein ACYDIC_11425 [Desulfobaccales bacterium]